jgi:AcrR family transcriptional regulator
VVARRSRKSDIVDAAIRLMAAGGSEALTASALARAAGVSKANLFHHFASLDDIVLAAFESFFMGLDSLAGPLPATLRAWLLGVGAEAGQVAGDQPQLGGAYLAFLSRAKSEPRLRARVKQIAEGAEAALAQIIATLAPQMDGARVRALAALVLFAGDGLALHRDLFPDRGQSQAEGWRLFVDVIAPEENIHD